MTTLLNLIVLPLRAPMLLLLLLISTYLGLHWSRPGSWADVGLGGVTDLIWSAECLQALVVVVVCTMPDLLLRRLSSIMAASRVASLVITLLLVITGGLYLLHLEVLSNVLILSSSVLLARLDLLRLRVTAPPFVMTVILSLLVLGGISLGRGLEVQLRPYVKLPRDQQPASLRRGTVTGGDAKRAPELGAPGSTNRGGEAAISTTSRNRQQTGADARPSTASAARTDGAQPAEAPAAGDGRTASSRREASREPDRAVPHPQSSVAPTPMP